MKNQKSIFKTLGVTALLMYASVAYSLDVKTVNGRVYKDITVIDYNSYNFDFSYFDKEGMIVIKNLSYNLLSADTLKALHIKPELCEKIRKSEEVFKGHSFKSLIKENEKLMIEDMKKGKKIVLSKDLKTEVYAHRRSVKLLKLEDMFGGTLYKVIAEKDNSSGEEKNGGRAKKTVTEVKPHKGEKGVYVYIPSTASVYPESDLKEKFTTIYPTGMNFDTVKYGEVALYELTLQDAVHVLHANLVSKIVMLHAVNVYKNKGKIKHKISNGVLGKETGEDFYPQFRKIKILEIEPYTPFFDFSKENPIPEELR